jgi:ATP-dependent Lon protease
MKLLVVEDNPLTVEPLVECLLMEGYQVSLAENGKAALELLSQESFDWVLTDIVMPDMDGLELLQAFRQRWPEVQCIAWSGVANRELYLRLAARLGAQRVLQKPIVPGDVIRILKNEPTATS